jgi:hypothetical protein
MPKKNSTRKKSIKKGGWQNTNEAFVIHKAHHADVLQLGAIIGNMILEYLLKVAPQTVPRSELINPDKFIYFAENYNYRQLASHLMMNSSKRPLMIDNEDYSKFKLSVIPTGTIFLRRQKNEKLKKNDIWLDYSARIEPGEKRYKYSFLLDPTQQEDTANTNQVYGQNTTYFRRAKDYFGNHLLIYKTTKPLVVFHFPVNYENPSNINNLWAYNEHFIRYYFSYLHWFGKVDGYTLDFLYYNPNQIYKNLPVIKNYRELYLSNNTGLELVEIIRD